MLTNSDIFLCSQFKQKIEPTGEKIPLKVIPRNLQRTSQSTFMFCDNTDTHTRIIEYNIKQGNSKVIEELEGCYSSWDFNDDLGFLLNRQGDVLIYNLLDKNSFFAQKQHPGIFIDAEIMHSGQKFITCGGSVKNPFTGVNQRIIKIWQVGQQEDMGLEQVSRINTGHTSHIQNSILINHSKVLTVSADCSLRLTNLLKQETQCIMKVKQQSHLLCTSQLDYNTVIAGGLSNKMKIFDLRCRRLLNIPVKINSQFVQVCCLQRFTDNQLLVCNLNEIFGLDLRKWGITQVAHYDGYERISQVLTLNSNQLVIGNRDRTMQMWKAS